MLSSIIRFGVVLSGAAILSSCGGGSATVAETQQSTPEGLFTGTAAVNTIASTSTAGVAIPASSVTENLLVFVVETGPFYAFYTNPATGVVNEASEGSFVFAGGTMSASNTLDITFPSAGSGLTNTGSIGAGNPNPAVSNPSFTGAYNTGINIAGTMTYPATGGTTVFNLPYNIGYQGIQDLSTLAGTYTGTVGTSLLSESATFTFSPASIPANSANEFGVATISGTGASGCAYTGSVSPLYKGNGYTTIVTSGGAPCQLPNTVFTGLIYLDTANNMLYSFAPNQSRTDGLLFTGSKL